MTEERQKGGKVDERGKHKNKSLNIKKTHLNGKIFSLKETTVLAVSVETSSCLTCCQINTL